MKRQSDDEWLASTRARFAEDGPTFDIEPDLTPAPPMFAVAPATAARCPVCEGRPPLSVLPYAVLPSTVPAEVCAGCLGIWAPAGSLSAGVNITADAHAAFRAARVPPRCRSCFGWLMPDGACSKCRLKPPPSPCPACDATMSRSLMGTDWLDHCAACGGTWYGTGEFPAVYGVAQEVTLLERAARQGDTENGVMLGGLLGVGMPGTSGAHPVGWLAALFGSLGALFRR